MTTEPTPSLVGRESEVTTLRKLCEGLADGAAQAILIRGQPGIGKTTLWRCGLTAAEAAGVRILKTRCAESEMPIALGALADLIDESFVEIEDELPPPQRAALASAISIEAASSAPDRLALPRAVATGLRLLCEPGPLLVAVDDAQWLDPVSLRLVSFALRRIGDRPIGALVTVRADSGNPDPLALATCYEGERLHELDLGTLSVGALGEILRSRLDVHLSRPAMKRVYDAAAGNPMYALELARGVDRSGLDSLARLRLPASLQELVSERVERLPYDLRPLLEVAAALERPTLSIVRRVIDEPDDARELLESAVTADVLAVEGDGRILFTHPLIASAVYGSVPPGRRRTVHARLAATLEDVEERAQHLALATEEPDAAVAVELEAAAGHAAGRGAPDAAAALAAAARRLTPETEQVLRAERGLTEARYRADSYDFARARLVVDELLDLELEGSTRAQALQLLYMMSPPPDFAQSMELLEHAIEHSRSDPRLHLRLTIWLAYGLTWDGDYHGAERLARHAVELADVLGDRALSSFAAICHFVIARVRGAPAPLDVDSLLARSSAERLSGESSNEVLIARERRKAGDLPSARRLLESELSTCEARGEELSRAGVLFDLADLELRAGDWDAASRHLDECLMISTDAENHFAVTETRAAQALLATHRGLESEARSLVAETTGRADEWGWNELLLRNRWTIGFLELSLGEPKRAWAELEGVLEALERSGVGEPGHLPAAPDVIETLVALTKLEDAARNLQRLETQAAEQEHLWARPAAMRCRALLDLANGEAERAFDRAERAASAFEETGHRFDRGRALLVAGDAQRRLGRRRLAAERLEAAHEIFENVGARLWSTRADRELRRAAPRPRSDDHLTAAERRVAALVVAGRTNRETAAELFTTVSTVEAHLTRIYRKLGVRSRTELARRASQDDLELDDA